MKILKEEPGVVADRINFLLRDAIDNPSLALRVNSDGLVLEYNMKVPSHKQGKFFEKVGEFTKNNS